MVLDIRNTECMKVESDSERERERESDRERVREREREQASARQACTERSRCALPCGELARPEWSKVHSKLESGFGVCHAVIICINNGTLRGSRTNSQTRGSRDSGWFLYVV